MRVGKRALFSFHHRRGFLSVITFLMYLASSALAFSPTLVVGILIQCRINYILHKFHELVLSTESLHWRLTSFRSVAVSNSDPGL